MFSRPHAKIVWILIVFALSGCVPARGVELPAPTAPTAAPTFAALATAVLSEYAFPASIDPTDRFLFYLHGKIMEDQGLPAASPEYGEYEYIPILRALQGHGFAVLSELRPPNADVDAHARKVVRQIRRLLEAGVPSGSITVVGASKGAYIAAIVSHLLVDPSANYVLLGTCDPQTVEDWQLRQLTLHGNILAIYDANDPYGGSCGEVFQASEGKGLGRHEELVLHVGTGHGILYKPLDDWILPTVAWAAQ